MYFFLFDPFFGMRPKAEAKTSTSTLFFNVLSAYSTTNPLGIVSSKEEKEVPLVSDVADYYRMLLSERQALSFHMWGYIC